MADRQAFSAMPETASAADPQSAALNRLTGIDEDAVRSSVALLVAFLVEFGSAFGFTLTILAFPRPGSERFGTSASEQDRPKSFEGSRPRDRKPFNLHVARLPDDLVTRWALDHLDIVSSGSIQADDAFQDFRAWCLVNKLEPLTPQMFGRRFTKVHAGMGGRKVRRRGRAYYEGASLQTNYNAQGQGKYSSGLQSEFSL